MVSRGVRWKEPRPSRCVCVCEQGKRRSPRALLANVGMPQPRHPPWLGKCTRPAPAVGAHADHGGGEGGEGGGLGGGSACARAPPPPPGWGEGWESERAWSAAPHSSLLAPPSPLLPPFLLPPPWRSAARSHRLELGGSNGRICFGQLLLRLPLEVKRALVFV